MLLTELQDMSSHLDSMVADPQYLASVAYADPLSDLKRTTLPDVLHYQTHKKRFN